MRRLYIAAYNAAVRIACIPNVSEGRRTDVVESFAAAVRTAVGATLLDYSADASHNRSVFTVVGGPQALAAAVLALFARVVESVDLRHHRGQHPRIGAVDVVPFVPCEGATLDACVELARDTAAQVADRFRIPIFLYEAAATQPSRRRLEDIRRGEFEALTERLRSPDWAPDFGPRTPHPTAGASAFGARLPLIAYNVNLATADLAIARRIAAVIRTRGGGLPALKALGLALDAGNVQVSMNLTDFHQTSILEAFAAVRREAARAGVEVIDSELIGLAPAAALSDEIAAAVRLRNYSADRILERRIARLEAGGAATPP